MTRSARLVHLALFVGSTLASGILAALRVLAPAPALPAEIAPILRYVVLATAAGLIVASRVLRARIPSASAAPDDEFWRAHLGTAIVTWALAEGFALAGAVFYYLTGDPVIAGVAGLGLVLLFLGRPGRLRETS